MGIGMGNGGAAAEPHPFTAAVGLLGVHATPTATPDASLHADATAGQVLCFEYHRDRPFHPSRFYAHVIKHLSVLDGGGIFKAMWLRAGDEDGVGMGGGVRMGAGTGGGGGGGWGRL